MVEVWTGRRDGVFHTADLDFIGPEFLTAYQIQLVNPEGVEVISGWHVCIEGVPIEFPMGPLGIGDTLLDVDSPTVRVPTLLGDTIRCLRFPGGVAFTTGLPPRSAPHVQARGASSLQSLRGSLSLP